MTDEQAVRSGISGFKQYYSILPLVIRGMDEEQYRDLLRVFERLLGVGAVLDAKDAEITSLRAYITEAEGYDTDLSRAEEATNVIALLNARIAEIAEKARCLAEFQPTLDELRARDEQAVREWLAGLLRSFGVISPEAQQAIALLDAKDAEIARLEAENSTLAAGSCDVPDGKIGDEHGHFYCAIVRERDAVLSRAEQAEAELAKELKAHQAFREEVSEAVVYLDAYTRLDCLSRFILPARNG